MVESASLLQFLPKLQALLQESARLLILLLVECDDSENCKHSGDSVRIRECSSEGQALLTEALCLLIVSLTQSNPCQINESGNHAQTVSCRATCMQAVLVE